MLEGKSLQWKLEAAGHIAFTAKNQKVVNA